MRSHARPFVRTFEQAQPYEQEEPGDAQFHWLIERDELPGLCVGRVQLKGPIHKTAAAHDTWDQAYVILHGSATIHLAGAAHSVTGPAVAVIPRGTWHSVEVNAGESLEYVFINQYR